MNAVMMGLTLGQLAMAQPTEGDGVIHVAFSTGSPPTFEAVVDAPDGRVAALESQVLSLEARLAELEQRCELAEAGAPTVDPRALVGRVGRGGGGVQALGEGVVVGADEVADEAVSFGGPVRVEGRVKGDAVSFGHDVLVAEGAHVQGDAVSFGGRVVVEPGGAVDGDRVSYGAAESARGSIMSLDRVVTPEWRRSLTRRLVMLLAFAGAGVLVVGTFPRQVGNVAEAIRAAPLRSGLLGMGVTGLAAVLATLLAITIIGIPVAALLMALVMVAWLLGFVAFCQYAGDQLPISHEGLRRWLAFLFGVAAVAFVGALPAVGKVTLTLIGMVCLGAAVRTRLGSRALVEPAVG